MPAYSNPGPMAFRATIKDAGGGGAFVEFPYSVEERFGVKGRVPVVVSFEGIEYRGSLVKRGGDCHLVPMLRQIRDELGKEIGDQVDVSMRLDEAPRVVEVAADLREALAASPHAQRRFDGLAYSHQREYVQYIDEAKKPETRARRIERTVAELGAKAAEKSAR